MSLANTSSLLKFSSEVDNLGASFNSNVPLAFFGNVARQNRSASQRVKLGRSKRQAMPQATKSELGKTTANDSVPGMEIRLKAGKVNALAVQEPPATVHGTPQPGAATPMGATLTPSGSVNFAVYSPTATAVTLCLYTQESLADNLPVGEILLDEVVNCSGSVWHVEVPGLHPGLLYGYKVDGPVQHKHDPTQLVLDPYATTIISRDQYGVPAPAAQGECWPLMASAVPQPEEEFDWQGDQRLQHREEDLVVYEMHVRGFTVDETSGVSAPGTFQGMIEKLDYIQRMGFTAVELMPIQEFNELEYYTLNPATSEYRYNFWGYSTVGYNAPMIRYAAAGSAESGRAAVRELKELVRACHQRGLEVIMDVVYNHTAEGNEMGLTLSFRGLANQVYYVLAPGGEYYNYSGCGNTFNCNHPAVRQFILDSLKYWVTEFHIDGFRFDLASILTRAGSHWEGEALFGNQEQAVGEHGIVTGTPLGEPPLIEMISNDPVLQGTRLIAEAWDAGGLYQVGKFPHWGIWGEWNGTFRDAARNFIKGTDGMVGEFAEKLCGSPGLYMEGGRSPHHGVNFITAHDGFTMKDVVSYNEKQNFANGEDNNDGEEHNLSWNCGGLEEEGDLAEPATVTLRDRQFRNLFVALLVAQGTPMVLMGDEYGHTKLGNNNTYCHDNALNWFKWDQLAEDAHGYVRFVRCLLDLRRSHSLLGMTQFPNDEVLAWHGVNPDEPDWSETSRHLAYTLTPKQISPTIPAEDPLYISFNAGFDGKMVKLPILEGRRWVKIVDTSIPAPFDFSNDEIPPELLYASEVQCDNYLNEHLYLMMPYSSIILRSVVA